MIIAYFKVDLQNKGQLSHFSTISYWGSGGKTPHINLGTKWRRMVSFSPRYRHSYSLHIRMANSRCRSGRR